MKKHKIKTQKQNILKYLKRQKLHISLYLFSYIVASVCNIFITLGLAKVVELLASNPTNYTGAINYAVITLILTIVQRLGWYLCGLEFDLAATKIMSNLNYDLATQAFKLNSKTFSDHETGTFVQRIVSDPEKIVNNLAELVELTTDVVTALIMLVYISTLNTYIGLVFLFSLIVGMIIELFRIKARRKNRSDVRKKNDRITSLTTEIVRSEKDIKSLGLEHELGEYSKKNYEAYKKSLFHMDAVDRNLYSVRNLIVEIGGMGIIILGIYLMQISLLTLGTFMIIFANRSSIRGLVWTIGHIADKYVDIKICHGRMFALFDEKEFVTEKFGDKEAYNIVGEIEFKGVEYSFKEYEYIEPSQKNKQREKQTILKSENKVFDNLSFKITPNTTVAFVGKSGSGKSTILNLMTKMFEVDGGEVLIDGININDLNKPSLRQAISLVNQFPYIFDMTIKENLLLANGNATDEEIDECIQKASLKFFINSLPNGINTKVGESGIKLSGGQKQRLAIARAFLRHSPIVIFDESTSSLDNFAQNDIKRSIDELKGHSTIVIVAHRLTTIKNVDKIFFLDEGKIIDEGSFDELFNRNEKFKAMFLAENI